MIFKYIIINALKGRNQERSLISPLQGFNLCVYPFHRALPDANAIKGFQS